MQLQSYILKGQGRETKAIYAEQQGRYPLSRALPIFRKRIKLYYTMTPNQALQILKQYGYCGEYKTGMYGMHTGYYDVKKVLQLLGVPNANFSPEY